MRTYLYLLQQYAQHTDGRWSLVTESTHMTLAAARWAYRRSRKRVLVTGQPPRRWRCTRYIRDRRAW